MHRCTYLHILGRSLGNSMSPGMRCTVMMSLTSAAVIVKDIDVINTLTRSLKCGTVWGNTFGAQDVTMPFGGGHMLAYNLYLYNLYSAAVMAGVTHMVVHHFAQNVSQMRLSALQPIVMQRVKCHAITASLMLRCRLAVGYKQCGIGREGGSYGLQPYINVKAVYTPTASSPWR